jgi:tetratricopeptide (TPR) repeat protein
MRSTALAKRGEDSYNLALAHLLAAQMLSLDARGEEADRHLERAERLLVLRGESSDLGVLRAEQAKRAVDQGRPKDALAFATEAVRLIGDDARYLGSALAALGSAYAASGASDEAERYLREAFELLKERRQWREASAAARQLAAVLRTVGRGDDAYRVMEKATMLVVRSIRQESLRVRGAEPPPTRA